MFIKLTLWDNATSITKLDCLSRAQNKLRRDLDRADITQRQSDVEKQELEKQIRSYNLIHFLNSSPTTSELQLLKTRPLEHNNDFFKCAQQKLTQLLFTEREISELDVEIGKLKMERESSIKVDHGDTKNNLLHTLQKIQKEKEVNIISGNV